MPFHNDNELTVFVGNLHPKVTEELLYELFLQVGPLKKVSIPKYNGENRNFGFVTFRHEISVSYAIDMLQGVQLFGQYLNLKKRHIKNDATDISKESQMEASTGNSIRNDDSSANAGQNLSKGPLTEVAIDNMKIRGMEMKTSTPLTYQHFHGQQDKDMRNNSFTRPVPSTPQQNWSQQSILPTPPSHMRSNNSSYMLQNGSRSFGSYYSPAQIRSQIIRSQMSTPQRSQLYHQNSSTVPVIQMQNQPRMFMHNSPTMPIHSTPVVYRHGLQRQELRNLGNCLKQNFGMQSFYTRPHPYQG